MAESAHRAHDARRDVAAARERIFGSPDVPFADHASMLEWIESHRPRPENPWPARPCPGFLFPRFANGKRAKNGRVFLLNNHADSEGVNLEEGQGGLLRHLTREASELAQVLRCSETQATALLLLGWVPVRDLVTATVEMSLLGPEVGSISLHENYGFVPAWYAILWHREAKAFLQSARGAWPWNSLSNPELADFVLSHPGLSWEQRRIRWNTLYPDRAFSRWQNMARSYYRARPKKAA